MQDPIEGRLSRGQGRSAGNGRFFLFKKGGNMGIFDIIGPIMVGPSSSHTAGAARIGLIASRILGEPLKKAHITLYGSFAKTGKGHGTNRALAAGLMGYAPDSEIIRTALETAKEKRIDIAFSLSNEVAGHPNVAKIDAEGVNGTKVSVVGRSLGGGRVMITEIDGYDVEINGEEYTFLTRHHDVPGIVADVSAIMAQENINISTMHLFRKGKGTEAVMIIHTDQYVPKELAARIEKANPNISCAMTLEII